MNWKTADENKNMEQLYLDLLKTPTLDRASMKALMLVLDARTTTPSGKHADAPFLQSAVR